MMRNRLTFDLKRGSDAGFSLIETLAAILIFGIITLGITPLLISSMRGAALTRSQTVAKNLGQQTVERARGLPFFESMKNESPPRRRDVLDLYFPDLGNGYDPTTRTFVTTCTSTSSTPAASASLACPTNIPPLFTVTISTRFVRTDTTQTPQTFVARTPAAGYSWASLSTETPPSNLLEMTVRTAWLYGGRSHDLTLITLMGDRRLAPSNVFAAAQVDYVVQASTSFREAGGTHPGRVSRLDGFVGMSESSIINRAVAAADQTVRPGRLTLTRDQFAGPPSSDSQTLHDLTANTQVLHSPPNSPPPTSDVSSDTLSVSHPQFPALGEVAFLDASKVVGVSTGTQVTDEQPKAQGGFEFTSGVGANPTFWMMNQTQAGDASSTELLLHPTEKIVTTTRESSTRLSGSTSAEATALSPVASRKVEATAAGSFAKMLLFPTTYITASDKSVLVITGFEANIRCNSTSSASATVEGTWSATMTYWRDTANDGSYALGVPQVGTTQGSYSPPLTVSGSLTSTTDLTAAIGNPLVYDDVNDSRDVYLLKSGAPSGLGYFESIKSTPKIDSTKDATGRMTTVNMKNAIQLVTARTDPSNPESSLTVSIGSMSCEAVDQRGLS